ncbi:MAG TPA: bifunctional phosphopantothenoylcysteine decarboxylase/phosphopantothenate--cysteine ligase CoaBC [Coleofasciculaceae cyanobacterium]
MDDKPHILVGVTGGIAAYKVCDVISALAKDGAEVRAILTAGAQAFIAPVTFSTLCRAPAYTDQEFWSPVQGRPLHIELGEWANVLAIAPLTANTLAKLVYGLADNLLTNTVLASTCPILLAPAMNTDMWEQSTVQRNWQQLQAEHRYHTIGPASGILACDRVGAGRMAEPSEILDYLHSLLHTRGNRDLSGKHLLISAGGTQEYLDPVRFIGNPSTGKMGLALALAALHRGAKVTLVHGPLGLTPSFAQPNLCSIPVVTAAQMQQALLQAFPTADWLIMAAAVADVRPGNYSAVKLAKADLPSSLPLEPIPDIVAGLAQLKQPHQRVIGFAAQTGEIIAPAIDKLHRKNLDAIAANPVDQAGSGFGSDTNQAVLIDRNGRQQPISPCSKLQMAHQLIDFVHAIQ